MPQTPFCAVDQRQQYTSQDIRSPNLGIPRYALGYITLGVANTQIISLLHHTFTPETLFPMQPQEMPLNTPFVITNEDFIHVTATRTSEHVVETVYRNPSSGDEVLALTLRNDTGASIVERMDKIFWKFSINGIPATEQDLQDLIWKQNLKFHVNPKERSIIVNF